LVYFSELVKDLLSYEEEKYNQVLKKYFTEDAVLTHPILNVQGRENIRKVFRVWTSLNKQPPEITNKDHLVFK
jgi:ketosteroid isomerase-like protein